MKATTIEKVPKISIIVAVVKNTLAIGKKTGELLFRIPDDLKRFKILTTGHPIIMGRKTHESIGKPLPNRTNIVVTRNQNFKTDGCVVAISIEDALRKAGDIEDEEIFIIGGGDIYKQTLSYADKIYMTIVESNTNGEVFFPEYRDLFTEEVFREERFDKKTGLKYTWTDLERKESTAHPRPCSLRCRR